MDSRIEKPISSERAEPDSVRLSELAIAAGRLGCPLTLHFRNYPAPALAGLWAHLAARAGLTAVLSVDGAAGLRQLRSAPAQYALVFVRDARLYTEAAWALRIAAEAAGAGEMPAVFTTEAPDAQDDPATTLTLHPHPEELRLVEARFTGVRPFQIAAIPPVSLPRAMAELTQAILAVAVESNRLSARDYAVVWCLCAGAIGLQRGTMGPAERVANAYAEVYQRLRGKTARPSDEVFDPLAVAMVGRANVYLRAAHDESKERGAGENGDGVPPAPLLRADAAAGVTRREVTDLGHPNGGLVTALVERLRKTGRLDEYRRLGLKDTVLPTVWPNEDVAGLTARLLPWTEKQVRSHFTKLLSSTDANSGCSGRRCERREQ